METWILFFWFAGLSDSEIKSVEFSSEANCEAAGERIQASRQRWEFFCIRR